MRLRHAALVLALLAAGGAAALWLARADRQPQDLRRGLQDIVSNLVRTDPNIRNCVLAVSKGDGPMIWAGAADTAIAPDTPIYIASVTKLYVATAIMLLYEKGLISLEDPMAKYLPQDLIRGINVYGGKDYSSEITIAQLLSHRSGIADYYSEKAKDGKTLAELLREQPDRKWSVEQTIARARDEMKPDSPPGTKTSYSDTNYQLLGKVIEAVSGKPLHVVFEDFFFRPLGLDHTWLVGHPGRNLAATVPPANVYHGKTNITRSRANSAYWADGGIVSTASDMIAFLKALNQGRIIRRDTLQRMHQWHRWQFPIRYGYGTMYFELPQPVRALARFPPLWGNSGSTGSFLYYAADLDLYLAGTIDQTESKMTPFILMRRAMGLVRP
ncbi:MAG TPA: serine hydrolase domain-containing protein [Burkholderiales bacterium]|nr:serine hydrolase domain-containing protein [Burkholderiales bacterium]